MLAAEFEPIWNEQAEVYVLGTVLTSPAELEKLDRRIEAEDFFARKHQLWWRAIQAMSASGQPILVVPMADWLRAQGLLEQAGGTVYGFQLLRDGNAATEVAHFAGMVRECAALRATADAAMAVYRRCHDGMARLNGMALAQECQEKLHAAVEPLLRTGKGNLGRTSAAAVAKELCEQMFRTEGGEALEATVPTGFPGVDALAEVPVGALTALAGEPGSGKSSFCRQIVTRWARAGRRPHVIVNEDKAWHYVIRDVSERKRINGRLVRNAVFGGEPKPQRQEVEAVIEGLGEVMEGPAWTLYEASGMTAEHVAVEARRAVAMGAGAIVVETFTRIRLPRMHGANKVERVDHNIEVISDIAGELGVPFLVTVHLRRLPEEQTPTMHDLRDSGNWENCCRLIYIAHRRGNDAQIIVAKANHDAAESAPMVYEPTITSWRERGPNDPQPASPKQTERRRFGAGRPDAAGGVF